MNDSIEQSRRRIIIADDDPFIGEIYRTKLTREGFEIACVRDGEEAIAKLQSWHPDLLLLDMSMPRVGGVEVLKFIRSDSVLSELPVIVLSNTSSDSVMAEIWDLKPTVYLTKRDSKPKNVMDQILAVFSSSDYRPSREEPSKIRTAESVAGGRFDIDSAKESLKRFAGAAADSDRADLLLDSFKLINTPLKQLKEQDPRSTVYQYANAFENLYETLYTKPESINRFSCATLIRATSILNRVLQLAAEGDVFVQTPARALVAVEPDELRDDVCHCIDRPGFSVVATRDSSIALSLIDDNRFDIACFNTARFGAIEKIRKRLCATPTLRPQKNIFLVDCDHIDKLDDNFVDEVIDIAILPLVSTELVLKACVLNVERLF